MPLKLADICASDLFHKTWSNVNDMSKCYDITLRSILDKHAPLKLNRKL